MEFWAIRHKAFGEYMPAAIDRQARGWTHWTPVPFHAPLRLARPPRLFATRRAAQNALTCWLQGEWHTVHGRGGDWENGYHEEPLGVAPSQPRVPRRAEEMELVQMTLEARA